MNVAQSERRRQRRMNMSKIAMGACCLLLTGCGTHQTYPSTWPALVKTVGSDCPDLSGLYQNSATADESGWGGFLYDALINEGVYGTHPCAHCEVQIQWLDETHDGLRVRLMPNDEVETLRRSRGEFNCHDGGLTVPLIAGATELVSTLVNWGHLTFWLAPDGSLVALEKAKITGYVLFIPFYDWHEVYRRWLRVDTPEPNSVAPESDPLKTRQLAEEGDVAAQYSLAYMLEFGADQRVPLDYFEAYKWFTIVAARESTPPGTRAAAVLGRDFVASKIDAQQIAEAEQRARDWTAAFEKRQQAQ